MKESHINPLYSNKKHSTDEITGWLIQVVLSATHPGYRVGSAEVRCACWLRKSTCESIGEPGHHSTLNTERERNYINKIITFIIIIGWILYARKPTSSQVQFNTHTCCPQKYHLPSVWLVVPWLLRSIYIKQKWRRGSTNCISNYKTHLSTVLSWCYKATIQCL